MKRPRNPSSPACWAHELSASGSAPDHPSRAAPSADRIRIKRIYDKPSRTDGLRILVDRLWPRGVRKEAADLDAWIKDIAPTPALRQWFGHDPERFSEFGKRYRAELRDHGVDLDAIRAQSRRRRVTLLYGAHDPRINHATILRDVLLKH